MSTTEEKQFGLLSEFRRRDVELFRSSDRKNTGVYFLDRSPEEKQEAYFELLRFEYQYGDHQLYIRFPNTDHFVEMVGGGIGSSIGNMISAKGQNPWGEEWSMNFDIFSQANNLLFVNGLKINFMTKVASYGKGNPYNHPFPNEKYENVEELEAALSMKYLKVPEHIRTISYCLKTNDERPTYFLVDCPKYNFQYSNHRFFVIKEDDTHEELKITNFVRYKDGGTTEIQLLSADNKVHSFFSPSSLGRAKQRLFSTFDRNELEEVTEEEKERLIRLLGIKI